MEGARKKDSGWRIEGREVSEEREKKGKMSKERKTRLQEGGGEGR